MKFLEKVQLCGLRIFFLGGGIKFLVHVLVSLKLSATSHCLPLQMRRSVVMENCLLRAFRMVQEQYIHNISFLNLSLQTSWVISQDTIKFFCCTLCVDTNVSHVALQLVSHLVGAPPSCTCSKKMLCIWLYGCLSHCTVIWMQQCAGSDLGLTESCMFSLWSVLKMYETLRKQSLDKPSMSYLRISQALFSFFIIYFLPLLSP